MYNTFYSTSTIYANFVHQYKYLMEQHKIRHAYEALLPRNIVEGLFILINNQFRDAKIKNNIHY